MSQSPPLTGERVGKVARAVQILHFSMHPLLTKAVVQGKAGVQPWVVSVVPFVQVRPPSTHNQMGRWRANSPLGARQLRTWRAPTDESARAKS